MFLETGAHNEGGGRWRAPQPKISLPQESRLVASLSLIGFLSIYIFLGIFDVLQFRHAKFRTYFRRVAGQNFLHGLQYGEAITIMSVRLERIGSLLDTKDYGAVYVPVAVIQSRYYQREIEIPCGLYYCLQPDKLCTTTAGKLLLAIEKGENL